MSTSENPVWSSSSSSSLLTHGVRARLLQALTGESSESARAQGGSGDPVGSTRKAFAWARVSTDMQEERGLSLPQQLREIGTFAERNGLEIVGEFSEAASAFRFDEKRVEFHRMLDEARNRPEVSVILVHDFSRFSRDSVNGKALMRDLKASGVEVLSATEPTWDEETASGVWMEAVTFAKNEAYSREIAFHTRKGCRANIRQRDPESGWCYKNGGQPLWGYKSERVFLDRTKNGRQAVKSYWVLDDTEVTGRPLHEWTRRLLVELAAKGASLDDMRDFLNGNGVPARRSQSGYWSASTINTLLTPWALLKFAGHEVWNVHRKSREKKNVSHRPPSEWEIVEKAHPPIITEEEAEAIAQARRTERSRSARFGMAMRRAKSSPYLLSGGLFTCARCGSNMTGFRMSDGREYYVCGSVRYRRGAGCGKGVWVPKDWVEQHVLDDIRQCVDSCSPKFLRRVNDELHKLWKTTNGVQTDVRRKLAEIEKKSESVYRAVEAGLDDVQWANDRLRELKAEREALLAEREAAGTPPQVDIGTVTAYCERVSRTCTLADPTTTKTLIHDWVSEMNLAPVPEEVRFNLSVPEPAFNQVVAGAGFEPATFGL